MAIFFKQPPAFGLDISELSLKFVQLKKERKGISLVCFGEQNVPKGLIEKGEIQDIQGLSEVLKKALLKKKKFLKSKQVILGLPEEKSFFDIIKIPKVSDKELPSAVRFEAENYIPFSFDEVYFDFEKSEATPKFQNILVAAIPKKIADPYLQVLKKAGLQPRCLEIESSAIARALIDKDKSHSPLLLLDFGGTRTGLIIFSGKYLRFTTTLELASRDLTTAIAKELKISKERAEQIKRKQGLEEKRIFEAAIPFLTDFLEQIRKYIDYYQTHTEKAEAFHNGNALKKILLCGGGSLLKGLPEFLSEELEMEVRLGNPWVNILSSPQHSPKEMGFKESLRYTTALGLALRGVEGDI